MNFNKNPNRSFDKPSFEGRKEKETLGSSRVPYFSNVGRVASIAAFPVACYHPRHRERKRIARACWILLSV